MAMWIAAGKKRGMTWARHHRGITKRAIREPRPLANHAVKTSRSGNTSKHRRKVAAILIVANKNNQPGLSPGWRYCYDQSKQKG